jgi:hypothetical protein
MRVSPPLYRGNEEAVDGERRGEHSNLRHAGVDAVSKTQPTCSPACGGAVLGWACVHGVTGYAAESSAGRRAVRGTA